MSAMEDEVTTITDPAAGSSPVTDATPATAVVLQQVTKRFAGTGRRGAATDDVVAVDDVTLEIRDGEFFSLLGPSGCGKTTTLRMVAGFEYPTSGQIRVFGEDMGLRPPNKRPINTVFQSYALFPHMTVEQNVAFGLEMQGVDAGERRRRVAETIELVQLQGRETRRPRHLSGGQQQRVALARALVNQPKVLLLDEPLGALDLKLRQAMQLELKQVQERVGVTFVYVTHDQEEALTMSDRIAVMDAGRVLQVGTPMEIYDRPRTRFVADFIGDTNLLEVTVTGPGRGTLHDGTLVRTGRDLTSGAVVTAAIRPERLGLVHPDVPRDDALDEFAGTVARVTFLGNAIAYDVRANVDSSVAVRVRQGNAPGMHHVDAGDPVRVRWAPTSLAVLDD